jgi:hypothetical protein
MSTAANLLSRAKKILGVDKVEAICRPGYYSSEEIAVSHNSF